MRGPGGRPPRLGLGDRCHIGSRPVGRRGQSVKCLRISLAVSLVPQPHPHSIRGPGDRPTRLMAFGSSFQIFARTQLLRLWHVPDTHRPQNGRARCLNWRSSPQHKHPKWARFAFPKPISALLATPECASFGSTRRRAEVAERPRVLHARFKYHASRRRTARAEPAQRHRSRASRELRCRFYRMTITDPASAAS